MSENISVEDLPDFNIEDHLKTTKDALTYLKIVFEEEDLPACLKALDLAISLEEKVCSQQN